MRNKERKLAKNMKQIPGGPKKLNKTFSYNYGCLAVIIWFIIVVYFKMAMERGNRVKASVLLRTGHKVSEVANLVSVSRTTSTRSRSAWARVKVLTGAQAVVERQLGGCHSRSSTGNGWSCAGTTLSKAALLPDIVLRASSLRMAVMLNKVK